MNRALWNIEEIVEEVLAALRGQRTESPPAVGSGPPTASGSQSPESPSGVLAESGSAPGAQSGLPPGPESGSALGHGGMGLATSVRKEPRQAEGMEDGQVRVSSRLVTMAHLRACGVPENLAGLRRLVVRPDALLTPMVRDELQRRNIPVVSELSLAGQEVLGMPPVGSGSEGMGSPSVSGPSGESSAEAHLTAGTESAENKGGQCRRILIVHGKGYEPAGLLRQLAEAGLPVEVRRRDCILEATDQLAEALRDGQGLGVLLTRYVAMGVCAANRHPGIRAIWAMEPGQAAADARSLGANLLVIAPSQVPPYPLGKMIREFYQAGVRPCPEGLRSRLG